MKLKELTFHAVVGSLWFSSRTRSLLFSLALKKKRWTDSSSYKFIFHLWAMVGMGRNWGKRNLCLQYGELWMPVSLEQGSTKSSSGQEMSFGRVVHTSPRRTTSWSGLKLRGCYLIVTVKPGIILMESNLSFEALSPRQEFHRSSGGGRMALMIFGSTHCYKHEAWGVIYKICHWIWVYTSLEVSRPRNFADKRLYPYPGAFPRFEVKLKFAESLPLWSRLSCSSTCITAVRISEPDRDSLGTH